MTGTDDEVFVVGTPMQLSPTPSRAFSVIGGGSVRVPEDFRDVELRPGRRSRVNSMTNSERSRPRFLSEDSIPNKRLRPTSLSEQEERQRMSIVNGKLHPGIKRVSTFSMPGQVGYHNQDEVPQYQPQRSREGSIKSYQVGSNGKNMVLQLVLPQPNRDPSPYGRDPSRPSSPFSNHVNAPEFKIGGDSLQSTLTPSFISNFKGSNHDLFSPKRFSFQNQTVSDLNLTRTGSVDGLSERSFNTAKSNQDPPPTSPAEKRRMFRGYLTVILSCVYAVFIVTLGVVIYIADLVSRETAMAESFSLYLVTVGLIWMIFLYSDIRKYLNRMKEKSGGTPRRDDSLKEDIEFRESPDGDLHLSIQLPWNNADIPHHYCFSYDRHSGSFYLKVGAAGFCFGHLIHSALLLSHQVTYFTTSEEVYEKCAHVSTLVLDIIYPTYSFFQLFIIFKYSNVIINRCKELGRFAVMHCIASSICFWFWTILRETMDSLTLHGEGTSSTTVRTSTADDNDDYYRATHSFIGESLESLVALPLTSYHERGAQDVLDYFNGSSFLNDLCKEAGGMSSIFEDFSPYLYPFTIEYSILVVGVLFIIWQHIGGCEGQDDPSHECHALPMSYETGFSSNLVIHADCHSANKGLFAGMIVLVGSVVSIILFFITMANKDYLDTGLLVNSVTELILLILMTVAVIFSYRQLTRLDVNKHPISQLDDLLLFICIPAFFLYAIFSIVPAVEKTSYLSIVTILMQVIQVLLQTPFIIDGLRRCSNTHALRYEKPGRELVTFLIVCNVAMWITETFEIKSHKMRDDRYAFYGEVLWTMLSHMTLPLTMFFRFHSSVCLVDIWKSAYERGN